MLRHCFSSSACAAALHCIDAKIANVLVIPAAISQYIRRNANVIMGQHKCSPEKQCVNFKESLIKWMRDSTIAKFYVSLFLSYDIHKIFRKLVLWEWVWGYADLNLYKIFNRYDVVSIWSSYVTSFLSCLLHKLSCPHHHHHTPSAFHRWGLQKYDEAKNFLYHSPHGRKKILSCPI